MKRNQVIIAVVLLATVGIVAFIFLLPRLRPAAKPIAHPPAAPGVHIVIMRNDKFYPPELEITAGETVKFVNDGDFLHWLASDPHPTHTINPLFDSLGELSDGESYSFTFTEAGSFPYHNHAVARLEERQDYARGVIIVTP